ncbi:MAG: tRNA (guanosine(46)-N7)-methyltransferase TrmB [Fusobacteriaceae bacterium]|jgi:tRNA (guanine-N7-)-methyltransferase|nr:tRNA (guanosine(46)-N7)-methyltransferase TrmB [Fusobacteriaceae bacterium]
MENNLANDLWKHFFVTPKKNYNKYMLQLLEYPECIIYDKKIMDENRSKWSEQFKNNNDICLEIGSGSGNFIKELAFRNKDKNYICLELRFKRLILSVKKIKKNESTNVRFLRRRGEEIENFLGMDEISDIYINFPDPWEENERNRIIKESFFVSLDVILKKGGKIFFKSDHDKYYNDILQLVEKLDNYQVVYHTPDLHNSPLKDINIKTEFEQLFLCKHNKNINYIEINKVK